MTTDLSRDRLNELLADENRANNSGLRHLMPDQALDEITSTLLDYRAYCKDHQLKLLNYLLEMAILEAIEVQMSLGQDDPATQNGFAVCAPATNKESQNELSGDSHDQ